MPKHPLALEQCQPRKGSGHALDAKRIEALMGDLSGWTLDNDGKSISKDFAFKNFYRTIAFVNALAWIANAEDHHPDLEAGYGHCRVRWSTHDVGGLSLNDFICAAKTEALL